MTLRRRLIFHLCLMLLGIATLAAVAITAVANLRDDYGVALAANEQLRDLYSVGVHLAAARSSLGGLGSGATVTRELQRAGGLLDLSANVLAALPQSRPLKQAIADAVDHPYEAERAIDIAYTQLADASAAVRQTIVAHQTAAERRHRRTLMAISGIAVVTLAVMVWLMWRQYRSITRPLDALHRAVAALAKGQFSSRANPRGDAEFVALERHFNRMADELAAVHAHLKNRVATQSRELSQAQRLASIGYLAAGVAHEINNPLGIIAGYGQRTLRRLDGDSVDAAKIRQTLGIICDEAFRCKKITDRLLMLARPAPLQRQAVHLPGLIQETIASLAALRPLERRQIESRVHDESTFAIEADADALRQVVLNLLINAVEATAPETGRITIETRRGDGWIELSIRDNGRGIPAARLPHIFEPFVTDQRSQRAGTGLGLAIALSIVSDHGGSITASSDGADQGSQFVVRFPVVARQADSGH